MKSINASLSGANLKDSINVVQQGISTLQQQRATAVAQLSGRKGGQDQLNNILPQIDQQISQLTTQLQQLRTTQKQVLDDFSSKTGLLSVAPGARDAAQGIAEIAATLRDAAAAGASAAQQTQYLGLALGDLTAKIGRDLRGAEQDAIDLLLQQIDLQKQREQIISDAATAEQQARAAAGLDRALTPAQQAALQIKAIEDQKNAQLQAIDEQLAQIDAQIGAQKELFGLTSDRNDLLAKQLDIQKEITAETVAAISAQMAFYNQLLNGTIPSLPAGIFPGSSVSTYSINGITIQVNLPAGTALTPDQAASIVKQGLDQLGRSSQLGFGA